VASLEALGAEVISAPTIRIESLSDTPEMRNAARDLSGVDWLVFTSANGVDSFFEAREAEGRDVRGLAGVRVAAIGPATGDRLKAKGVRPDLVPERFVAEALLEAFDAASEPVSGKLFVLPRAEIARDVLADGLRDRGASVVELHAYRTLHDDTFPEALLDRIERDEIDLVTFSSSSTVHNFVAAISEPRRAAVLANVRAASIGPVTSATLQEYGISIAVDSEVSTIPGLTQAIIAHFTK
jgi:uroporphyrinogen III methyltransferase/synthase